jgi:hypothetical protein
LSSSSLAAIVLESSYSFAMAGQEKAVEPLSLPPNAEMGASSMSLERDDAAKLVGERAQDIDPDVAKRVLGKIDWFLIPAMIVGTFTSQLFTTDEQSLTAQAMDWSTTTKPFLALQRSSV